MVACFYNLHEKENAKDLSKHFDKEIEIAIGRGCSLFLTGTNYPEDALFAERVNVAKKYYAEGEIGLIELTANDDDLKHLFIKLADWEIFAYECE